MPGAQLSHDSTVNQAPITMATSPKSLPPINKSKPLIKSGGISGRALAFTAVLFILAITLAPPLQRYFVQRAQINALQAQVNDSKSALEQATRDLALWNDPKYVASQARSRLHFVFPGERQYIVLGAPATADKPAEPAAAVAEQIPTGLPWYSKLIASITSSNVNH